MDDLKKTIFHFFTKRIKKHPLPFPDKDICAKCGDYRLNHPFNWRESDGVKCLIFELGEICLDYRPKQGVIYEFVK